VILIKNIYTLWGLRVTSITQKNTIVEYLDYQIPDTQLKGQNFILDQSIGIDETYFS